MTEHEMRNKIQLEVLEICLEKKKEIEALKVEILDLKSEIRRRDYLYGLNTRFEEDGK